MNIRESEILQQNCTYSGPRIPSFSGTSILTVLSTWPWKSWWPIMSSSSFLSWEEEAKGLWALTHREWNKREEGTQFRVMVFHSVRVDQASWVTWLSNVSQTITKTKGRVAVTQATGSLYLGNFPFPILSKRWSAEGCYTNSLSQWQCMGPSVPGRSGWESWQIIALNYTVPWKLFLCLRLTEHLGFQGPRAASCVVFLEHVVQRKTGLWEQMDIDQWEPYI